MRRNRCGRQSASNLRFSRDRWDISHFRRLLLRQRAEIQALLRPPGLQPGIKFGMIGKNSAALSTRRSMDRQPSLPLPAFRCAFIAVKVASDCFPRLELSGVLPGRHLTWTRDSHRESDPSIAATVKKRGRRLRPVLYRRWCHKDPRESDGQCPEMPSHFPSFRLQHDRNRRKVWKRSPAVTRKARRLSPQNLSTSRLPHEICAARG